MYFLAYYKQKIALLQKKKNLLQIDHFRTVKENVKLLDIVHSIVKKKRWTMVTGLETDLILSRSLTLKLKSKKEILAALPFQVESILPYPEKELILLPTLKSKSSEILLVATSKAIVSTHLEEMQQKEIDPDIISCIPVALYRFARHFFPKYPSLFIHLQEGAQHTFVVVKEDYLVASQSHKGQDLERMTLYMKKKYPEIAHLLTIGHFPIETSLTLLEVTNPNLSEYAIPIGLALDAAAQDTQSVQFRRDPLPLKEKKRKTFQKISYLAACLLFSFTTLFLGKIYLKKEEAIYLEALGAPSGTRLSKAVEKLEKSLYLEKKSPLAIPTIPRAHEFLAWLSKHPALTKECSISRLNYQVVKFPRLASKLKTFQAKVEFELTTAQGTQARIFHESLLKDKTMIDLKEGVKWDADHGIYKVSFYLKSQGTK